MINAIILFITAALGLVCTIFIVVKNNHSKQSIANKYLIFIIVVATVRFFLHGIMKAYPEINVRPILFTIYICFIMLLPCFYLYFKSLVYESKFEISTLLHLITPFLIGVGSFFVIFTKPPIANLAKNLVLSICILSYLTYMVIVFVMLKREVWNRKTDIKSIQKQNELIKNWSIFLFLSFVVIFFLRITTQLMSKNPANFNNDYIWIPAIAWIIVFVKIILTPEVLYGYNLLNKMIDDADENLVLNNIWNLNVTVLPLISIKDKKIEEKINPLLIDYLHQIEKLSFHTDVFRNPDLGLNEIAMALNIPISHINYIFKYHCKESFIDYKKIVRIHDATKLLKEGYHHNNKLETLSKFVGFSSYTTFFISFKSITGVTMQEYIKRV